MTSLTVCTWNVGSASKDNLAALMDRYPVLCLQEMSDRDNFYDYAQNHGWGTFDAGGDNGKHATPVFWDKQVLTKADADCDKLSDSEKCPGTGPDQVKTKWLMKVVLEHKQSGKKVRVGCLHLVSDSANGCRRELAHDELVVAAKAWPDANELAVLAGDYNTSWDNNLLDPLRNKGWKTAHKYKVVKTHGGWTPDQQWYRNGKITGMGERTNGSDHDALWVEFEF